jgi:hypothetical protein
MMSERHDLDDPGRADHSAGPEQQESGFGQGQEDAVRTPQEEEVGEFSEGLEQREGDPAEERVGRFSDSQEDAPETVDKNLEGSFASGQETHPEERYEEAEESAEIRQAAAEELGTGGSGRFRHAGNAEPGAVSADPGAGGPPRR